MPEEQKTTREDVVRDLRAAQQKLLDWMAANRITTFSAYDAAAQLALAKDRLDNMIEL